MESLSRKYHTNPKNPRVFFDVQIARKDGVSSHSLSLADVLCRLISLGHRCSRSLDLRAV